MLICFLLVSRLFGLLRRTLQVSDTHIKKRGTFGIFSSQGVWRNLTNRITKSPRYIARAFLPYSCWFFLFSRQTLGNAEYQLKRFSNMSKMCVLYYTLMFHRQMCLCCVQSYIFILNKQTNARICDISFIPY